MFSQRFSMPVLIAMPLVMLHSLTASSHGKEPIRLPIQLIQSNAVTEITVGSRRIQAGIDTGGGGIDLPADVIREAGGIPLEKVQQGRDAYGRDVPAPLFKVPAINIGGRTFRNVVVAQVEHQEGDGPPVAASIGRHFLHDFFIVIDYPHAAINLWPRNAKAADAGCGDTHIRMEKTKGESHLVVSTFATPAGPLKLLWDTGATYSVLKDAVAQELHLDLVTQGDTPFFRPGMISAAGQDFAPLEFVVLPVQPPADVQGFLGANFFSTHVVCMDYRRREILVR